MKEISFSHNQKKIFEGLNFNFNAGEKIGLIGESGIGKSTFLNLFSGLLQPIEGQYFVNGKIINQHDLLNILKNKLAIVPQTPFLMQSSILENITMGAEYKDVKFKQIISIVGLDKLINNLKERENTLVHSSNLNFSGGQIQRIAFARALYREPSILLIDEGFNQLDKESENQLIDKINNLNNLTLIIVYHKIFNQKFFNRIYKI